MAELILGPLKNPRSSWRVRAKVIQLLVVPFSKLEPRDPSLAALVSALGSRNIVNCLCSALATQAVDKHVEEEMSSVILTLGLLLRLVLVDPALLRELASELRASNRLTHWLLHSERLDQQLLALSIVNALLSQEKGVPASLVQCDWPLEQFLQSSSPELSKKALVTVGLLCRRKDVVPSKTIAGIIAGLSCNPKSMKGLEPLLAFASNKFPQCP